MITLYQFAFSHFCEKARWALDYKALPHTRRNLLPGAHMKIARRLAARSCLPILVDEESVVQDSAAILSFLDQKYRDHPLIPSDPARAREAMEWEEFLNREIGVTLRLWFYFHVLPDRARALRFLLAASPWYRRPGFALAFPRVRAAMSRAMKIDADAASAAEQRLLAALARLDAALESREFLVGDCFSRADLTACALLAPYCRIGDTDSEASAILPEPLMALRATHRSRRYFGWVGRMYERYRRPTPELRSRVSR